VVEKARTIPGSPPIIEPGGLVALAIDDLRARVGTRRTGPDDIDVQVLPLCVLNLDEELRARVVSDRGTWSRSRFVVIGPGRRPVDRVQVLEGYSTVRKTDSAELFVRL
jgi:hypothetical protein